MNNAIHTKRKFGHVMHRIDKVKILHIIKFVKGQTLHDLLECFLLEHKFTVTVVTVDFILITIKWSFFFSSFDVCIYLTYFY